MRNALLLLLIALMLLAGCTEEQPRPSPSPKKIPTGIAPDDLSPSPSILPTATPRPLLITNGPKVEIENLSARISWTTNLKSNTILEWGVTPSLGQIQGIEGNVTGHATNISGLAFLTEYFYRVASCVGEQCVKSNVTNFTTSHKQCGPGMSYIREGDFCIDNFEAAIINGVTYSSANTAPTTLISKANAEKACIGAGKHLCTAREFIAACNIRGEKYGSHVGDKECNIANTSYLNTGLATDCISTEGVHDQIGNVWEWVADAVDAKTPIGGGLVDRDDLLTWGKDYPLPRQANANTEKHGQDYYHNLEPNSILFIGKGIAMGGYYKSQSQAGCFAYEVGVPLEGDATIGFRCCS